MSAGEPHHPSVLTGVPVTSRGLQGAGAAMGTPGNPGGLFGRGSGGMSGVVHSEGGGGYNYEEQKVNSLIRKMMRDDATSRTIG